MTKPSYEEPKPELCDDHYDCKECYAYYFYWQTRAETTEAELARVRGLLQRQWISVEERLPESKQPVLLWVGSFPVFIGFYRDGNFYDSDAAYEDPWDRGKYIRGDVTHWRSNPEPPTSTEELVHTTQEFCPVCNKRRCWDGAESADIGKLDSVEKYPVFFPQPGGFSEWVTSDGKSWHNGEAAKKHEMTLAGSAETGGEKAAPASGPPECYCPENTSCICGGSRNG